MSVTLKVWLTVVLAALMAYTGYTVIRITKERRARPVAQDAVVPDSEQPNEKLDLASFEMTERSGQTFGFDQLKGKIWVASLFYSSCPHQCRRLNESIAALQKDPLFSEVQFVSISVDPAVDTPEALAEYAKLFEADAEQWLFLQGDLNDVGRFGREADVPAGYKTHTRRLVLFDREGRPHGYFKFNDAADINSLRKAVAELLETAPAAPDESDSIASGDNADPAAGATRPAPSP